MLSCDFIGFHRGFVKTGHHDNRNNNTYRNTDQKPACFSENGKENLFDDSPCLYVFYVFFFLSLGHDHIIPDFNHVTLYYTSKKQKTHPEITRDA
jgi:hypothetical protein